MKWSRSDLLSYSTTKYDIDYEVKTILEEAHIGKEPKCSRKVRKPTRRGRRAGKKKVCELYQQRNTQESEYRSIPVRITDRTYGGINREKDLPVRPQYYKAISTRKEANLPSVLLANVRSLRSKVDEVGVVSRTNNVSVVCLTETWLDDEISDSYVGIPGYFIIRRDRTSTVRDHGGGVSVYVKEDMP